MSKLLVINLFLPSLLFSGYHELFPQGYSGHSVRMTTHLHLVLELKMIEAIPPFPQHVSLECTETMLSFTLISFGAAYGQRVVRFISQYLKNILSKYLKIQYMCIFIPEHIYLMNK
jgi:hypothetical protein